MADDTRDSNPRAVNAAISKMKIEEDHAQDGFDTVMTNGNHMGGSTPGYKKSSRSSSPAIKHTASRSRTPSQPNSATQTPKSEDGEEQEIIGGDITITQEPGKAPKLLRKSSQKVIARPPLLFDDMPDSTEEAVAVFQVIKDCIYGSKHMGYSEHDALDCDCSEQWSEYTTFPSLVLY